MAQLDTYLVEKLREILQRLYTKKNEDVERGQNFPVNREKEAAYKRFPSLSHFTPSEELSSKWDSADDVNSASVSNASNMDSGHFNYNSDHHSSTNNPEFGFNESASYSRSVSSNSSAVYGEIVNCSSTLESSVKRGQSGFDGTSRDESAALTRSLHELIHYLKKISSLKSGTSAPFYSNAPGELFPNTHRSTSESYGIRRDTFESTVVSEDSGQSVVNPFSGIEAASTTNMEFNLTLDDITDLNNLLVGGESSTGLPLKHVIIILVYFLIACISIIGNLLVIQVNYSVHVPITALRTLSQLVIRSRRFHTLTHALLANLAAADLVLATFNIPFSAARVIMTEWPFGQFLCRAVPFIQVTSVYATSFTMAVIAMDRYQVIMNPLGKRLKCSQGIFLVISIWLISAVLSLPYALNHKVVKVLTVRVVMRCQADFGSARARQLLTVATFLAQYLLPLVFTTISYFCVMKRLWNRSSGLGSTTPRQFAAQSRSKLKTIQMLLLTLVFFALNWLPIHLYHLLTQFSVFRHNSTALLICHIIAMSSSMYNPFIFCGLNEHFRREALKWLRCFRKRRSPAVHPGREVNGMLARTEYAPRRNLSATVTHTTLSSRSRRAPQQQQQYLSPRVEQRRGILTGSSTSTAAVYVTPRHMAAQPHERGMGFSATRLMTNAESSGSPSYQPELVFLVRERNLSQNEQFDPEADPDEDLLDTLEDDISLYRSQYGGRNVSQYVRDKDDDVLSQEESSGENETQAEVKV